MFLFQQNVPIKTCKTTKMLKHVTKFVHMFQLPSEW
jgi:hypothetical protein